MKSSRKVQNFRPHRRAYFLELNIGSKISNFRAAFPQKRQNKSRSEFLLTYLSEIESLLLSVNTFFYNAYVQDA